MNIANLCYELYKIDWMSRISAERQIDTFRRYYDEISDDNLNSINISLENYLAERGYDGECFACFEEFLDAEFLDTEYMRTLLTEKQYAEYLKYIKEN